LVVIVLAVAVALTSCIVIAGICCCSAVVYDVTRLSVLVVLVVKVCCEPNSRLPAFSSGMPTCQERGVD
jgi:hypothetical protein